MTSAPRQALPTGGKILVFLFVLFAAVGFIDYFFYDQQFRNLLSGIGFSLLACGAVTNEFSSSLPRHRAATFATVLGSLILVVAIALRFLP